MINGRFYSVILIFGSLFVIGFVLMGYEMLGSRYLNPYFGGGITTWAALISVVLFAMMTGYLSGGYIIDKVTSVYLLPVVSITAGISIFLTPLFVDPVLEFLLHMFGDGMWGVLMGAVAITLVPVGLLSACSPFVIRLLLVDLQTGGRTAGWVYGVSTLGNVFGTLTTTFVFIPNIGTRMITYYFGITLVVLGLLIILARQRMYRTFFAGSMVFMLAVPLIALGAHQSFGKDSLKLDSFYPEGPIWLGERLYFAEMSMDRVMSLENGRLKVFWRQPGCGPTSISEFNDNGFIILCHLSRRLIYINRQGKIIKQFLHDRAGIRFQNPNDSHKDGRGGVFFTDSGGFNKNARATGRVFHIDREGKIVKLLDKLFYANGIAFCDSEKRLLVSEHLAGKVWDIQLSDKMSVKQKTLLFDLKNTSLSKNVDYRETGTDGIEITKDGKVFIAIYGAGRIISLEPSGQIKVFKTETKFVTNMAYRKGRLAIVGAFNNRKYPFPGHVNVVPLSRLEH